MNELESIFLNEPLEKPYNLRLCKLTAVPAALPTPNHRMEVPDQLNGMQGTPASPLPCQQHYPVTRCRAWNFPVRNYQNQQKEGGQRLAPSTVLSQEGSTQAVRWRLSTTCPDPGVSGKGLAMPVQQPATAARPVVCRALLAGCPVGCGCWGGAGGPVRCIPSGMQGPLWGAVTGVAGA